MTDVYKVPPAPRGVEKSDVPFQQCLVSMAFVSSEFDSLFDLSSLIVGIRWTCWMTRFDDC
jgi:hypothetical protein